MTDEESDHQSEIKESATNNKFEYKYYIIIKCISFEGLPEMNN